MTTEADYPPLRPCPFCGKVPDKINWDPSMLKPYAVQCDFTCGTWEVNATSRAEAADKWNRRAKL